MERVLNISIRYRHALANTAERITLPVSVRKRRDAKLRKSKQSFIQRNAIDSPLIISCKRREFNHFRDNVYVNSWNEEIPLRFLASGGWLHYKSKGDYFNINTRSKPNHLDKHTKFADLGLSSALLDILKGEGVKHPSHVQVQTIPSILDMSNVICAAETGCGKTLAYLLPILQALINCKSMIDQKERTLASPLAVILLPSQELAQQVSSVAERYCKQLRLDVLCLSQGSATNRVISSLRAKPQSIDVLVATPGSLSIALRSKAISPMLVNHVVIDEADTLMDESFNRDTVQLLHQLSAKPAGIQGMQIVLASATLPRTLHSILGDTISAAGFVQCMTENLHHMLGHVTQRFMRLGHVDKPVELVKVLAESPKTPTMVFVKNCGAASYLHGLLREKRIESTALHGDLPGNERKGRFKEFQEEQCNVLVCSDVASRGLDTLRVSHVINYDFPFHITDYIHRAGRVGRLGSHVSGKVTNFIGHRPEVNLVWQIERAVRSNRDIAELPDVNTNTKGFINNQGLHVRRRFLR
ncbi:probable ATP-dependent RNA helicase DDX28 [Watersipora subatra]|uniref:probable ATP-dependent RNA helicase DDX28 n=1 Tax=Watersipora subatra TaxID=2589382 RepID=UPI00355B4C15